MGSGMMRVPRTTGRPDTLPGTCSISSHAIQSISVTVSSFALSLLRASKDTDESLINPADRDAFHRVSHGGKFLNRVHPLPHRPALPVPILIGLHFVETVINTNALIHHSLAYPTAKLIKYIG